MTPSAVRPSFTARPTPSWKSSVCAPPGDLPDLEQFAPDEQSRQFIRERLSGRSIQSTLEEQAEDLDEERELIDTDVEDTDEEELLLTGATSEDIHDED